jgi:EAL domain-containing protein (putative c-di-GMP-specific phosphodiesterase class I)
VPLSELHEALAAARIHTRYQPVVRLSDRVPVGLEVLARLEHPQRGTLGPDLFVPQIEDAGLAFELTQAVVRRAFGEWGGGALEQLDLSLALNFPLDVLLRPTVLAWLDEQRGAAGIPPARIGIELTESRPVNSVADLGRAVQGLRRAGYALAIDDVGPGVRQAQHLLGLGFSALKLDKGLVGGSRDDAALADLLDATVAAAHAAGMLVVAEGVEDEDGWRRMLVAGVEQAQGFLIARPMAADAVPGWCRAWRAGQSPPRVGATN